MSQSKILNWMMKGPGELLDVYRCIEPGLLLEAISDEYKVILKQIQDYHSKYKTPPSYKILSSFLSDDDERRFLHSILEDNCLQNEIQFFIDELKLNFNKKIAADLSSTIIKNSGNITTINNRLRDALVKVEKLSKDAIFSEGNFTSTAKERLDDYNYTKNNPNKVMGVFSGYNHLDDYTWGIKNSEMMVISGATSSGKSLLMMNMAINAWLGSNQPSIFDGTYYDDGKNVVFVTLEMSKKQLEQRIDANIARIRHRPLMRGNLTDSEMLDWQRSLEFQKNYKKRFHIIDMPRGTKAMEIEAKYDALMGQFKPDLLCVDYLGIMKPNTTHGADWEDIGHTAENLAELSRKKNIPLITAAQRKGRIRGVGKGKVENVEDAEELGRSKMIGDNANIILLLESRNEEHLREDMIVHIVKNRDGPKGKFILLKDFEKSRAITAPDNWAGGEGLENEV